MKKGIIVILTILFFLSIVCGSVGFVLSKKDSGKNTITDNNQANKTNDITYEYYLEDQLISSIPENTEEKSFLFSKFVCTNGIIGEFDKEQWKFIPSEVKVGTCKIYFNKSKYEISFINTNATADETNLNYVERGADGIFKFTPNEGYAFSEITCSNDKEVTYNQSTNTLTINSITSDIACKLSFVPKNLKVDLSIKNGKTKAETSTVYYGERVTIISEPNTGYENPKITCTNNQKALYENNQIIIEKLTNDTKCNVEYQKVQLKQYSFKINISEDAIEKGIVISKGNQDFNVVEGTDVSLTLESGGTYMPDLKCSQVYNEKTDLVPISENKYNITFKFLGINSDQVCEITSTPINN